MAYRSKALDLGVIFRNAKCRTSRRSEGPGTPPPKATDAVSSYHNPLLAEEGRANGGSCWKRPRLLPLLPRDDVFTGSSLVFLAGWLLHGSPVRTGPPLWRGG